MGTRGAGPGISTSEAGWVAGTSGTAGVDMLLEYFMFYYLIRSFRPVDFFMTGQVYKRGTRNGRLSYDECPFQTPQGRRSVLGFRGGILRRNTEDPEIPREVCC